MGSEGKEKAKANCISSTTRGGLKNFCADLWKAEAPGIMMWTSRGVQSRQSVDGGSVP